MFEGSLLLIEDFDGLTPPNQSKFTFDRAAFWVRMVNLPLACMNQVTGWKIGSSVGVVEVVDIGVDGIRWGEFLHVKIMVDLAKPLAKGRVLKLQGNPIWIAFQYKRLPKLCFHCVVINHGNLGCPLRSKMCH